MKIFYYLILLSLPLTPQFLEKSKTEKQMLKVPFWAQTHPTTFKDFFNRFKFINFARAASDLTPHTINNIRNSIGLAIGYSDASSYGHLACNGSIPAANTDCTNAPPYNGIVGRLTDIINTLPSMGDRAGITSCEDVPASGSVNTTDDDGNSVTFNFESPTHTIPSPWLSGGNTFQKRIVWSSTILGSATKLAYEFNCGDSPASYIAINMDMGTINSYAYTRRIVVYTGNVSTSKKGIEVYMAEYNSSASRMRAADAIRIEYTSANNEYNLWGLTNTNVSGGQVVNRSILHGNYSTGAASFFSDGYQGNALAGSDGAIDVATVNAAGSFATAVNLTNGTGAAPGFSFNTDLSGGSGEHYLKGCIDFSSPDTNPANNSECGSFSLAAASNAPYVDPSTGDWSIHWLLSTMPTKLEVIP